MRAYPKDESFIWKDILIHARQALEEVKDKWRKNQDYPRVLLSWPSEHLLADGGKTVVTHLISFAVPEKMSTFEAAVALAKKTKAYALLLVEKRGEDLKIIVESSHGTRCWTLPIRRHGDVTVLEKESASENTDSIGVLWRRNRAMG